MNYRYRTWYLGVIAGYYLVICSANVAFHAWRYFQPGSIFSGRDFLPLLGTIAAMTYFFRPGLGHKGLLALTVLTILAMGESDPAALLFHLGVLGLLMLPFLTRRGKSLEKRALTA